MVIGSREALSIDEYLIENWHQYSRGLQRFSSFLAWDNKTEFDILSDGYSSGSQVLYIASMDIKSEAWLYNTKFTSGGHLWHKLVANNFVYCNDVDK